MGIFSAIGSATSNYLELKTLDNGSDILIAMVCKFEPLNVKAEYKKEITNYIKELIANNNEEQYTETEMALLKLCLYYEMSENYPSIQSELHLGMKKIAQMDGENIPFRTIHKALSLVDLI
jgi:hypothetical protein